ncbi:MAG: trimethylamine methyltransferase family protein [Pseudomonadota bacterium]
MNEAPKRGGGRAARKAARAAGPAQHPAPPGQRGGQYRPLATAEIDRIIAAAYTLLEQLGMGEVPESLAAHLMRAGCSILPNGRVSMPAKVVDRAIADAPKRFTLHGRDPARSIEVGGDAVHFGTGGAAVEVLDLGTARYRAATLRDLHVFTRLQDGLDHVSWFTRCCIATDMGNEWLLDLNTAYALMAHTTKPVATAFTLPEHVAPLADLFRIAGDFDARPFVKAHISPVISPMRFGEDAVAVTEACIAQSIPLSCITAAQAGATAPATLAGFLAQSLAETLASLVMVQVIRPGHPMVFSNWPFVIDLRTGAFAGGGGETALLNAASAQIINHLGLPSGVAACMTDAKAIDAQYGTEKAMTATAAALAGGNLIYESAGMTASLLGASFEAFLLDAEMHAQIMRMLRGVEVSEDTLDITAITEAVLGEGHFLGGAQTIAAMERDYLYPELADRATPTAWAEDGAQDAWGRARAEVQRRLAEPGPDYLDRSQTEQMRARFGDSLIPNPE